MVSGKALCLALLMLAVAAGFVWRPASAQTVPAAEASFAGLISRERASSGLTAYHHAADLTEVARAHAGRMADDDRLYHNPNLRDQVQNWDVVGENVGKGQTVEDIHQAFMQSDTHRREILSARLTEVGVGVVSRNGLIWVSQVFRRPTAEPAEATTAPVPSPTTTSVRRPRPAGSGSARSAPVPSTPAPTSAPAFGPGGVPRESAMAGRWRGPAGGGANPAPLPGPRDVPREVALATGLLLVAVAALTTHVGGQAAAGRGGAA